MSGFKSSSIFSKFALLVAVTNGVFFICGFGSSYWQTGTSSSGLIVGYGLWTKCTEFTPTNTSCVKFDNFEGQGTQLDSGLRVTRGLTLSSFICLILTAISSFIYIYNTKLQNRWTAFVVAVLAYGAGALCLGGLIVYGNSLVLPGFSLSWSFAMTVLAMLFNMSMAVLFTVELKTTGKKEESLPPSGGIEETSHIQ